MTIEHAINELNKLCLNIFEDTSFSLWVFSKSDNHLISSKESRKLSIEEHATARKTLNGIGKTGTLPSHHALNTIAKNFSQQTVYELWEIPSSTFNVLLILPQQEAKLLSLGKRLINSGIQNLTQRLKIAQIIDEKNQQNSQLKSEIEQLKSIVIIRMKNGLDQIAQKYAPIHIRFTHPLIEQLAKNDLDLLSIEKHLVESIELKLFLNPLTTEIELDDSDFIPELVFAAQGSTPHISKHERVIHMLNRYEEAAQLARQANLDINSKHIAELLNPSVSPPAISDALKKNRKGIEHLLVQFPDNWKLIRSHLRPIVQLDELISYRGKDVSSSYAS